MTKTAAILVLALPALLVADINRLNPNPDLVADDARTWSLPRVERSYLATSFGPPSSSAASRYSGSQPGLTPTPCPTSCPTRAEVCQPQPDCRHLPVRPAQWLMERPQTEEATARAEAQAEAAAPFKKGKTEEAR